MLQEKYSWPRNNSPKPGWKSQQGRQASRASILKKILYDENNKKDRKWIHELPHVIWGLIDYNTPRAKTSQIPGTYRTYESFTHKKTHSDSCSSSAKAVSFRFNLEAMCHRIRNVNSLLKF
jgi:hypothetical protein